ncbi:MaoC family dehydratase N-terminal domain-containing protein [Geodermatophilus sp. DSM 44513]|uniref:FAS1-like dehydratase domain-containing protein n=1 Tax=Geodermatophilus sp. DSM 44513 TaxID=1528104 RepID=UPI001287A5F0|nr:MaoC family dehydratase N-terminal domain-containing protein [Geodermatophilus sp. DSM 44513]WNV77110.1 MaoC family dehydratase N-terminal domain-containing protein [Geodermatophilus sp. DSM 44513]
MTDLHAALAGWAPEPEETAEVVGPWPAAAFSAVLDLPAPAAGEGDPLPLLWHWFSFLGTPRQSGLGEDGHPAAGRFLPPVPDRRRMIAGGRVRVRAPILVGERVTRRAELAAVRVTDGRSGPMAFVTTRYTFRRGDRSGDDVLLTEEQDVVYRSQPAGQQRVLPVGEPDAEPEHDWRIETATGPELLFRFSALTHNAHRIHYDQPYVTGVEGYPGLVVHGPLLALLLLEVPRRHAGRPVSAFDYRLTSPVFAGATVLTHGRRSGDDELVLSSMVRGGRTSITGTARLS